MGKTVRNYEYDGGRDGAKIARMFKHDDTYNTGFAPDENAPSPANAKKRNKKAVNKHNRALRNALEIEME